MECYLVRLMNPHRLALLLLILVNVCTAEAQLRRPPAQAARFEDAEPRSSVLFLGRPEPKVFNPRPARRAISPAADALTRVNRAARGPSLADFQFYDYEVRFTNPVCELVQYRERDGVPAVDGSRLLHKPKDAYCKASDGPPS